MAEFIEEKHNQDFLVFGPEGWAKFEGIGKTIEYDVFEVILEEDDGRLYTNMKCADSHVVRNNEMLSMVHELVPGEDYLQTPHGLKRVRSVTNLGYKEIMYDLIDVEDSLYYTNRVASHNSTTICAFALWYAMFNKDKYIGIASNKLSSAKDILRRLKTMYENCPKWLKPGITVYSKLSVEFENGSLIEVSATSDSAFRGRSINLLICLDSDNPIRIRDNVSGEEKEMTIEEFYQLLEKENGE